MQFRVADGAVSDTSYNPVLGEPLRTPIIRLADIVAQKTRRLTLNEVEGTAGSDLDPVTGKVMAYPGGPLEVLINNTRWGGTRRLPGVDRVEGLANEQAIPGFTRDGVTGNYLSELPKEGDTEIWEIVNLTNDAHPMHLHLVQFQVLGRRGFHVKEYAAAYAAAFKGGFDLAKNATVGPGLVIPAYGPPLDYNVPVGGDVPASEGATPEPQPAAPPPAGGMPGQQPAGMGSPGEPAPPAGAFGGNPDITPFLQGPGHPAAAPRIPVGRTP